MILLFLLTNIGINDAKGSGDDCETVEPIELRVSCREVD